MYQRKICHTVWCVSQLLYRQPGTLSCCDSLCSVRLIYAAYGHSKPVTCSLCWLVFQINSAPRPLARVQCKRRFPVGSLLNSMQATVQQPLELVTRYIRAYVNNIMSYSNLNNAEYSFEAVGWDGSNLLVVPVPLQQQQQPQPPQEPMQAVQTETRAATASRRPSSRSLNTSQQPGTAAQPPAAAGAASTPRRAADAAARQEIAREQPQEHVEDQHLRWGSDSIPAAPPASDTTAAAAVDAVLRMVLAAVPSARQVLSNVIQRLATGNLSASTYDSRFVSHLRRFQPEQQQSGLEGVQQQQGDCDNEQQREPQEQQQAEECPLCGDMIAAPLLEQHVAAEWDLIREVEQQHQQQQEQQEPEQHETPVQHTADIRPPGQQSATAATATATASYCCYCYCYCQLLLLLLQSATAATAIVSYCCYCYSQLLLLLPPLNRSATAATATAVAAVVPLQYGNMACKHCWMGCWWW